jgi:cell wall-associated NlpC family hydrolase
VRASSCAESSLRVHEIPEIDLKKDDMQENTNKKEKNTGKQSSGGIRMLNRVLTAVIGILVIILMVTAARRFGGGNNDTGDSAAAISGYEDQAAAASAADASREAEEKQQIIDSYGKLGIADVEGYLNIRQEPTENADIIGKLQGGAACTITDDSTEGWYQITSNDITGYVNASYMMTGSEAASRAEEEIAERAVVTADAVNIRKEASTDSEVVGQALKGERYLVREPSADGWIGIDGGYISADYAEVKPCLNEARKLDMKTMVLNLYDNLGVSKVDNYLNVRETPGDDTKIIGKMTSKCGCEIIEMTTDHQWYKIQSGPVTGYVKAEYIATGDEAKQLAIENAKLMAIVSTDMLNARTEPSTDAPIWTQISNAERYDVVSQQDGWVQIALDEDETAYVRSEYVDVRYALPEAIKFTPVTESQPTLPSLRTQLVNYALQFVGGRYVWGGNDPHTGADCSGFVKYCYQHVCGITLERVSRDQAQHGTRVSSSQMQPGDLIFYANKSGVVHHVAMYIGNGQIVHAASRRSGIKISTWNYRTPYRIVSYLGG